MLKSRQFCLALQSYRVPDKMNDWGDIEFVAVDLLHVNIVPIRRLEILKTAETIRSIRLVHSTVLVIYPDVLSSRSSLAHLIRHLGRGNEA